MHWAQKNATVPDAAKAFPKLVFVEFLKLRRHGADIFYPGWRTLTSKQQVCYCLDAGAAVFATLN